MNPIKMKKNDLVKEVVSLRDNLSEKQGLIDDLKQQIREKDAELVELKDKISQQGRTIEEFEANIKATKEELEGTVVELQKARSQVVAIRNDAQGMESKLNELVVTNSKLKVWKYDAIGAIIAFLIALCVIVA